MTSGQKVFNFEEEFISNSTTCPIKGFELLNFEDGQQYTAPDVKIVGKSLLIEPKTVKNITLLI